MYYYIICVHCCSKDHNKQEWKIQGEVLLVMTPCSFVVVTIVSKDLAASIFMYTVSAQKTST